MGNLRSVEKAFEHIGVNADITSEKKQIENADGIVLPGVGAFKDAIDRLNSSGLSGLIKKQIEEGKPFLGICLGLQLLFEKSEEDGWHDGLAVFEGVVRRLPNKVKVPHMGWNEIEKEENKTVYLDGIKDKSRFYFVHSYYVDPVDEGLVSTKTEYGVRFTSSIARNKLFACQFHPEKSGLVGLELLKNFMKVVGADS
jgi:glutamine amidotransferase